MSERPEPAAAVSVWLVKAGNDLKTAEHTLTLSDPDCPLDTVCFHAQQCAEKSLKAFLASKGIPFEKTHDLGQLLYQCRFDSGLIRDLKGLDEMTHYAVDVRYADVPPEQITRSEAVLSVALARRAYETVRHQLHL